MSTTTVRETGSWRGAMKSQRSKLDDLNPGALVMVDRIHIFKKLTISRRGEGDNEIIQIINHSITDLILRANGDELELGPIMTVENAKKVFPDYKENPPVFHRID